MTNEEIVKVLRGMAMDVFRTCEGCDLEENCSVRGCAVMLAAADAMENLKTENASLRRATDALTDAQAVMVKEFTAKLEELDAYKSTGLEPDDIKELCTDDVAEAAKMLRKMIESGEINHLQDLLQAEQDGRLFELPFVAMVEQSLQNGKMKPMGDQKHNGRYAVVYVDRNKWKSPLIDICGKPYQREEAEIRMAALSGKGSDD